LVSSDRLAGLFPQLSRHMPVGSVARVSSSEGIFVLRWPVEPMRAVGVAGLPDLARVGAVAEPKWDGFRAVARRSSDGVEVFSRHGRSLTAFFPNPRQSHRTGDRRRSGCMARPRLPVFRMSRSIC
jgi:ATP-dependent DNA ligase